MQKFQESLYKWFVFFAKKIAKQLTALTRLLNFDHLCAAFNIDITVDCKPWIFLKNKGNIWDDVTSNTCPYPSSTLKAHPRSSEDPCLVGKDHPREPANHVRSPRVQFHLLVSFIFVSSPVVRQIRTQLETLFCD